MKQTILAVLLIGSVGFAETPQSEEAPQQEEEALTKEGRPVKASVGTRRGTLFLSVDGYYSAADAFEGEVVGFPFKEKTRGAAGVGVSGILMYDERFGVDAGVTYDFFRSFTEEEVNGTTTALDPQPIVTVLLPRLNILYKPHPKFGVVVGLNKAVLSYDDISGRTTAEGKVGYQVGAMYQLSKKLIIEGAYRVVNASFTTSGIEVDGSLAGLQLGFRYVFGGQSSEKSD